MTLMIQALVRVGTIGSRSWCPGDIGDRSHGPVSARSGDHEELNVVTSDDDDAEFWLDLD